MMAIKIIAGATSNQPKIGSERLFLRACGALLSREIDSALIESFNLSPKDIFVQF